MTQDLGILGEAISEIAALDHYAHTAGPKEVISDALGSCLIRTLAPVIKVR